jgi:hypothetical protein
LSGDITPGSSPSERLLSFVALALATLGSFTSFLGSYRLVWSCREA